MNVPHNILSAMLVVCWSLPAFAALQPSELAILANKNSQDSQKIASYYAQQRGVPTNQICVVDIPKGEELTREAWDKQVRPAIRRWIATNRLQNKIRCIVTVWDVPLKIGKQLTADTKSRRRLRLLQLERARRVERLLSFAKQFDAIAQSGQPAPLNLTVQSTLQEVTVQLSERLKQAEARIQQLPDGADKQAAVTRLTQLSVGTAGLQVVTQNMKRTIDAGRGSERIAAEFQFGRGRLTGLSEGQSLVDGLPPTVERDTNLIALIERATGIAGTVQWIDAQLDIIQKNETHTSFDSELSLVLEGTYPLLRWLPNYLHYNYDNSPLRQVKRMLMVSRLEAPTLPLTKALIDNAIAVEKSGLTGKVYLDARGLTTVDDPSAGTGTQQGLDRSILLTEKLLKENTQLEVVLNNDTNLFAEGSCPDAALYCGWFSLAKYVDAFTWNPGAVGYHMAAGEASTIRTASSQVWCKQMLDRGVVATTGPVYEPYLLAFPRPNEFFALLCSGKYSYVECMYRTKATTSWTMTTIGDPLYNPFKAKPALSTVPVGYERLFEVTQTAAN